jgi:tetratricopeptide (TPR) repeat protein
MRHVANHWPHRRPSRPALAALLLIAALASPWAQNSKQGQVPASPGGSGGQAKAAAPSTGLPVLTIVEPYWEGLDDNSAAALKKVWRATLAQAQADLGAGPGPGLGLRTIPALEAGSEATAPRLRAVFSGEPGQYMAQFLLEGVPAAQAAQASGTQKYLTFERVEAGLNLELARALESLARYFLPRIAGAAPILVDSFSPTELQSLDLTSPATNLYPYGLAARKDGRLLVACISTVIELSPDWQVVGLPAKALSDEGNYNFAFGLALTPAGTLFIRNSEGSAVWSFTEGSASYQRLRVDLPPNSSFGVLSDGSPFVVGMQAKSARVYKGGTGPSAGEPFDIPLPKDSMILAAAAGPDSTLWLADTVKGSIRIVSPEGKLRDIIFPDLPLGTSIMKLRVLPDSGFLVATNLDIRRFDASGRLLWTWDGKAEGLSTTFSTYTDIVPGGSGTFYVNDLMTRRIYRLAERLEDLPPALAKVAAATKASRADGRKAEPWLALADAYDAMGSLEAERVALDRYLELRPADAKAADRRLAIQAGLLKAKAASGERDVAALVKRFGPETAREAYNRAMRSLESLRALLPGDPEVESRIAALKRLMNPTEAPAPAPLPQVRTVELAALFPSLLQAYRTRPAGAVVIRNSLAEAITDLKAELFVPKYMDFPSAGKAIARLEPGAEARLDLSALLNEKALEVEEDLPVQALITVRFQDSRGARSVEVTRPITLYRRTALTWDDTGKLASFITPNEDTVSRAAFRMVADRGATAGLPKGLQRAAAICDSLGALPLAYVPDPQSSFSEAQSDRGVVDTVRFPRTTLAYQGGDCDDTTALLSSLLEAAGLHTAILTSPGHVFLAFDSGERPENAWLLEAPGFVTVAEGGVLWIPLESTDLAEGFAKSWKTASGLVAKYRGGPDFELRPLAALRASYPALPLPPSALPVPQADPEAAAALDKAAALALDRGIHDSLASRLDAERKRLQGKDWSRATNRLALVHARFGHPDLAASALKELVAKDPSYVSAYLNLAALGLEAGKADEALAWLKAAQKAVPGSSAVASWAEKAGLAAALSGGAPPGQAAAAAPPPGEGGTGRAGLAPTPEWAGD